MQKLLRFLSGSILLFAPFLAVPSAYAASATMVLSPSSTSVVKGSTLTVYIYENSGSEPVNAASADLSYPANLLSFSGISSSSAFTIVAANSGGGGNVNIDRGALPAVSGNQLVASVRFKALTNTASASISFTGGSKVVSANSNANILTGTRGGTYALTNPAPVAPKAPTPPPPPKDTTPPTITQVAVSSIGTKSATVTWTTSEPANSEVDYGINNGYGLTAGDSNFVTAHKMVLDSALLEPGTQYHFIVKSVDPSGNASSSKDQAFTTKGATVVATVVNQKKKPVSQAKVTINGVSGVTNSKGQVTLSGLQVGKTVAVITYKNKQTPVDLTVKPISDTSTPQDVTLSIQVASSHTWLILLPLLLLAALVLWALRTRRLGPPPKNQSTTTTNKKGPGSGSNNSKPTSGGSSPSKPASNSNTPSGPTIVKPTILPRQ